MTFIEFKKQLLDAEISLPKFAALLQISEKNVQAYKKKGEVPNTLAALAKSFATMNQNGIDFRKEIIGLSLEKKSKTGGFAKKQNKPL
ncbi:MAG: hypothetical protein IE909_13495 [Campylobacterales bacterium]|nr:hypothetical protein [Campylobacterales bacterium]